VALPLAIAVQEATARLGLLSGKGLAALIKREMPRWVLYVSLALVTVANTFNIGADLGSMAAATHMLALTSDRCAGRRLRTDHDDAGNSCSVSQVLEGLAMVVHLARLIHRGDVHRRR